MFSEWIGRYISMRCLQERDCIVNQPAVVPGMMDGHVLCWSVGFMEVIFSSFIVTCFIRAGKDSNISASGAKLIVITFGIYWMFARTSWDSPGYKDVLIYRFSWTLQATVMPFVRSCFIFDLAALSSTLLVNWTEGQAASLLGICVFTFLWN